MISNDETSLVKNGETRLISYVIVFCGIGLNVAPSIYFASVNIYALKFPAVLGWMSFSVMLGGIIAVFAQIMFDKYFDYLFGTKSTYSFRIGIGLLVMGGVLIVMPFAVEPTRIVWLGVCLGLFGGATLASLSQMASVVNTTFTRHIFTGMAIGQLAPIGLSVMVDFSSVTMYTCANGIVFAWLPAALCLLTFVMFSCTSCFGKDFNATFDKMDASLVSMSSEGASESNPLAVSATQDAENVNSDAPWRSLFFHRSVSGCACVQLLGNVMAAFLLSLFAFFGGASFAHTLVLIRFGSELAGRFSSHYIGLSDVGLLNGAGLTHLLVSLLVRAGMIALLMLEVTGSLHSGYYLVAGIVALFYFSYAWIHSELHVLIVHCGPPQKKVELMQSMTLLMFSGQVIGSIAALALAPTLSRDIPEIHMHGAW